MIMVFAPMNPRRRRENIGLISSITPAAIIRNLFLDLASGSRIDLAPTTQRAGVNMITKLSPIMVAYGMKVPRMMEKYPRAKIITPKRRCLK